MIQRFFSRYFPFLVLAGALFLAAGLRLWQLSEYPVSPYWEEVALGYDAYSILKTGKDHHGTSFPIVAFESFGDWKPSGYFYFAVPSIALFGLTTFATRLPTALAGIAMTALVAAILYSWANSRQKYLAAGLGLFVTAVSPWALQFSRGSWEVMVASCFILVGVWSGLGVIQKTQVSFTVWRLYVSVVSLILSMYIYHGTRLTAPLLGVGLLVWWIHELLQANVHLGSFAGKHLKALTGVSVMAVLLIFPLAQQLSSPQVQQRIAETSLWSVSTAVVQSNQARDLAGNTWWSRFMFHRYVYFGQEVAQQLVSHLHPAFLFVKGDANPRHSLPLWGQLYWFECLPLLLGIAWAWQKRRRQLLFLVWWWLAASIPASLSVATPHALRTLPSLPVLLICITWGWLFITELISNFVPTKIVLSNYVKPVLLSCIVCGYVLFTMMWWRTYTTIYPAQFASEWQYGYEQVIDVIATWQNTHPGQPVYISRFQGRPAMYYWFYTQTDPTQVQAAQASALKDQSEFLTFQNLTFFDTLDKVKPGPGLVAISAAEEPLLAASRPFTRVATVSTLTGEPLWTVVELQ
jgi:hypothetical protein